MAHDARCFLRRLVQEVWLTNGVRNDLALSDHGESADYLRFKSPSAIRNLKMRGLLRPAGRRGED